MKMIEKLFNSIFLIVKLRIIYFLKLGLELSQFIKSRFKTLKIFCLICISSEDTDTLKIPLFIKYVVTSLISQISKNVA